MSEVSHEWDKFYGYGNFYPGLYTPKEAWDQKQLINKDVWPLALDLCVGKDIYISTVSSDGKTVLLVNKRGFPAIEIGGSPSEYKVHNWHRQLKRRGRDRYTIYSKNRSYLLKVMYPHVEPICLESYSAMNGQLLTAASTVNQFLNETTNNAATIPSQSLSAEQLYAVLNTLFDPTRTLTQIESSLLTQLTKLHENLKQKFANKKSYVERLKDMFDHPKWMIAVVPQFGAKFLIIGSIRFSPNTTGLSAANYKLEYLTPPTLYRNFPQFYAKHPEQEGPLKTALMFCKVHREKLTDHDSRTYDTEGFIPCSNRAVYEDIGGISYCPNSVATVTGPHYLLLQQ